MNREIRRTVSSGYLVLVVLLAAQVGLGYVLVTAFQAQAIPTFIVALLLSMLVLVCWGGFTMGQPVLLKSRGVYPRS